MDSVAIWSRFLKTGKVEDYLMYKKSLKNGENPQNDGVVNNEDEYRWFDTQRTEYW